MNAWFGAPVASTIFVITVGVSLFCLFAAPRLIDASVLRPYWLFRKGEFHRLITSGFVHADLTHLIFNMLTFYFFAFMLERRIGSAAFLVLYFSGLVLSEIGTYFKHRNNAQYASLGASGAICAVLFAAIVYFPEQSLFIFPIPLPIPAPLFAVGYLAYSYWSSKQNQGRINHDAHFGGALTGLAFVALTDPHSFTGLLSSVL
jgi:membrane associated rhomboid family serine protease